MALTKSDLEAIRSMVVDTVAATLAAAAPAAPAAPAVNGNARGKSALCRIAEHWTDGTHIGHNADGLFYPNGLVAHYEAASRAGSGKADATLARIAELERGMGIAQ